MSKIQRLVQHRTLIFALILVCFCLTNSPIKASSESVKLTNNSSNSKRIPFKRIPAPNRRVPRGTRQAAKRGEGCPNVAMPLTAALVPIAEKSSGEQVVWGLTSAEYPTFWFYVPYPLTDEHPGELRIKTTDEKRKSIYKRLLRVTGTTPGVVGVRLPSTEAPLKIGELYTYLFVVVCNSKNASENEFVGASVERREQPASIASQLRTATPRERAILYAQEGFWEEALTTFGELRRANPNDAGLTADWSALLEAGGLDEIKQKPIVPSNQIKQEPIVQ